MQSKLKALLNFSQPTDQPTSHEHCCHLYCWFSLCCSNYELLYISDVY